MRNLTKTLLVAMLTVGCGTDEGVVLSNESALEETASKEPTTTDTKTGFDGIEVMLTESDVPLCDATTLGNTIYVQDLEAFFFCGADWVEIDLKGKDGVGIKGDTGEVGQIGETGEAGIDGTNTTGAQGETGQAGAAGIDGADGVGIKGDKGDVGNTGTAGIDGQDGTSITGATGQTGTAGIDGQDGSSGISGFETVESMGKVITGTALALYEFASCSSATKQVIGGGCLINDTKITLSASYPIEGLNGGSDGWRCGAYNDIGGSPILKAYVICADVTN